MKLKIDISKIRLLTAVDTYEVMQIILKKDKQIDITKKEYLWAMALDNSNKILNIELVSTGNIQSAIATPKEILSIPLQKKAESIVLIHNHPMQIPVPSNADKSFTDQLIQASSLVRIDIWDHLIITKYSFYSFRESGLLEQLEKSKEFLSPPQLERRIRKEVQGEFEKVLAARDDQVANLIEKHRKQLERYKKKYAEDKGCVKCQPV